MQSLASVTGFQSRSNGFVLKDLIAKNLELNLTKNICGDGCSLRCQKHLEKLCCKPFTRKSCVLTLHKKMQTVDTVLLL